MNLTYFFLHWGSGDGWPPEPPPPSSFQSKNLLSPIWRHIRTCISSHEMAPGWLGFAIVTTLDNFFLLVVFVSLNWYRFICIHMIKFLSNQLPLLLPQRPHLPKCAIMTQGCLSFLMDQSLFSAGGQKEYTSPSYPLFRIMVCLFPPPEGPLSWVTITATAVPVASSRHPSSLLLHPHLLLHLIPPNSSSPSPHSPFPLPLLYSCNTHPRNTPLRIY